MKCIERIRGLGQPGDWPTRWHPSGTTAEVVTSSSGVTVNHGASPY